MALALGAGCESGGGGNAPDDRIAGHHREMCKIAAHGAKAPREGVQKLFRFYGDRGPDMARDWAELLVIIERIDDDDRHDARARQAAKRIHEPVRRCAADLERFSRAIEEDPEASRLLERGVTRFSRTLEILFGKQQWSP